MKHNRWYDKSENLKNIIEALWEMNQNDRNAVVFDIIQLMIEKQPDKDNFLENANKDILFSENRLYDEDYMFHSVMKMLKSLPPQETGELLRETITPLMYKETEDHENFSW